MGKGSDLCEGAGEETEASVRSTQEKDGESESVGREQSPFSSSADMTSFVHSPDDRSFSGIHEPITTEERCALFYALGGYSIHHSCSDDLQMVSAVLRGSVTRTCFMRSPGTLWVFK
jgi:hypothetical protein